MADNKEVIFKLLKIAETQQKIIEKLAQQIMATHKGTMEEFNEVLQSVKTQPTSTAKVTFLEALSDGSYDIRLTGYLTSPEMQAFQSAAAARWTGGDKGKLRIARSADI